MNSKEKSVTFDASLRNKKYISLKKIKWKSLVPSTVCIMIISGKETWTFLPKCKLQTTKKHLQYLILMNCFLTYLSHKYLIKSIQKQPNDLNCISVIFLAQKLGFLFLINEKPQIAGTTLLKYYKFSAIEIKYNLKKLYLKKK